MNVNPSPPPHDPATLTIFKQGGRTYESRLNDCGKINCQKCGGDGTRAPSHGPYWYLCVNMRGKWVRIYLGKELDTKKYVTPEGQIDWEALKEFRVRKTTIVVPNPSKISYHRFHDENDLIPDTLPSEPNPLLL